MAHGISNDDPTKKEQIDALEILDKKLEQLAEWIRNAKHFIVFPGQLIIRMIIKFISLSIKQVPTYRHQLDILIC
jgi:hypothetical protein